MRPLTFAVLFAVSVLLGEAAFAQQFSYSLPGVDFGNRYGIDLGYGVGFGYGVGASFNGASGAILPTQPQPNQAITTSNLEIPLSPAQRAAEKQRLKGAAAAKQLTIELRRAKAKEEAKERNARIREFQDSHATRS